MCLLLFYIRPDPKPGDLYVVLACVRDEVYNRPTKLAHFWDQHPHVIGGMDMEPGKSGGTWLAMSKKGKVGVLLNVLQPDEEILPHKKGRGFLAADYVTGNSKLEDYLTNIRKNGEDYNKFLLLGIDLSQPKCPKVGYYTNSMPGEYFVSELSTGSEIHGYGNSLDLKIPWPKVDKAKNLFKDVLEKHPSVATKETLVEEIFAMLQNRESYPLDDNMQKQGKSKSLQFLNKLSAIYVKIPEHNYGSRCHTVIVIDGANNVDYYELSRNENSSPDCDEWSKTHKSFKL